MKINNKIAIVLFAGSLMFSGCSDVFDELAIN